MRLDKFLSTAGYSRKEAVELIKKGNVCVNNEITKQKEKNINENSDKISVNNREITFIQNYYLMLNKPQGVVSATQDAVETTVIDILPENLKNVGLFMVGRLDKETEGLLILTTDGELCHKLTSPKHEKEKVYYFELTDQIGQTDINKIQQGITLKDGFTTKPCKIELKTNTTGEISITEGKYHQVRRMFGAVGNKVIYLKRIKENGLELDKNLKLGECRFLTQTEIETLKQ